MSSGFVSGGTIDQPIERDDEWLKAQQEIEAVRKRKEEEGRQKDGKSLYEILEQNKAAKQDAFEESIRLKNQFRSLDDDEIEFLDSVLESTRAKEEAIKRETAEQLDLFRRQQEQADKVLLLESADGSDLTRPQDAISSPSGKSQWDFTAKKRRRANENEVLKGIKIRKSSSAAGAKPQPIIAKSTPIPDEETNAVINYKLHKEPKQEIKRSNNSHGQQSIEMACSLSRKGPDPMNGPAVDGLGLGVYGSDSDD